MSKFEQVYNFDYQTLDALTSELSDTAIAKKLGCSIGTIFLARKRLEIKSYSEKTGNRISRKSNRILQPGKGEYFDKTIVDRDFFKVIDSEIKAYTLGLIATDGFISYVPKGRYFGIELQSPDSAVLHLISQAIKGNNSCVKQFSRLGKKDTEAIRIYSRDLVEQLMKLGITLKTGNRQCIRTFPTEITRHYLRGIIDGDGGVHIGKSKEIVLSVSSKDLAYGFAELIDTHLGMKASIKEITINEKPFYIVRFYGRYKARPLVEWIYSGVTIAIPRKLEAANIWLSRF